MLIPLSLSHSLVFPLITKFEFLSSSILFAPTKNIAILRESLNLSMNVVNCSSETECFKNGNAIPTLSAPRAIDFAASRPDLVPPDVTTGTSTASATSTVLIAVGIHQSQNVSTKYMSTAL